MPRPTTAQFGYGSLAVVLSTLAMLLLSEVRSGPGVAVIAVAGLAVGLLVAMTVPMHRTATATAAAPAVDDEPGRPSSVTPLPLPRPEPRTGGHTLRS